MNRILTPMAVLVASALSAFAQSPKPVEPISRERAVDLAKLEQWVRLDRSFTQARRDRALASISGYLEKGTSFTDPAFYMEVRRIVALADNGHSNVSDRPIHESFGLLPLRLYWFADGLHIVRAVRAHGNLVGARVEAIDGLTVADLEERLRAYSGGTRSYFRRYAAPSLMLSPSLLNAVGLCRRPGELTLRVTDTDGLIRNVTIAVDLPTSPIKARPWRLLVPEPLPGEDDWATVLGDAFELPLYLEDPTERFRHAALEEGALVYIQLRANIGTEEEPLKEFAGQLQARLVEAFPHSIILDNRQNGGGDLSETAEFALALPSLAYLEGKVYVITDGGTFSAGIYTSFYPKSVDAERTVIVGEPVGDRSRFWAETGSPFWLTESGYSIGYALELHDLGAGCPDPEICHMTRYPNGWNLAVGDLAPDWPVPLTFAEFAAGIDPALERILAAVEEELR